jgi:hypothetical protein
MKTPIGWFAPLDLKCKTCGRRAHFPTARLSGRLQRGSDTFTCDLNHETKGKPVYPGDMIGKTQY